MRLPAGDSELIQIVDANFADAARRAGPHLVCRIGCTQCCHGAFAITALDALRLRSGMEALHAADPAAAEAIESRARLWIAEHAPEFPGDASSGLLGTSDKDRARFEDFDADSPCPALDPATGRCQVYAWRPITCRVFGPPLRTTGEDGAEGLGHCELCFTAATNEEIAACEMTVPHEREANLLAQLANTPIAPGGETVVAFALLKSDPIPG